MEHLFLLIDHTLQSIDYPQAFNDLITSYEFTFDLNSITKAMNTSLVSNLATSLFRLLSLKILQNDLQSSLVQNIVQNLDIVKQQVLCTNLKIKKDYYQLSKKMKIKKGIFKMQIITFLIVLVSKIVLKKIQTTLQNSDLYKQLQIKKSEYMNKKSFQLEEEVHVVLTFQTLGIFVSKQVFTCLRKKYIKQYYYEPLERNITKSLAFIFDSVSGKDAGLLKTRAPYKTKKKIDINPFSSVSFKNFIKSNLRIHSERQDKGKRTHFPSQNKTDKVEQSIPFNFYKSAKSKRGKLVITKSKSHFNVSSSASFQNDNQNKFNFNKLASRKSYLSTENKENNLNQIIKDLKNNQSKKQTSTNYDSKRRNNSKKFTVFSERRQNSNKKFHHLSLKQIQPKQQSYQQISQQIFKNIKQIKFQGKIKVQKFDDRSQFLEKAKNQSILQRFSSHNEIQPISSCIFEEKESEQNENTLEKHNKNSKQRNSQNYGCSNRIYNIRVEETMKRQNQIKQQNAVLKKKRNKRILHFSQNYEKNSDKFRTGEKKFLNQCAIRLQKINDEIPYQYEMA